MCDNPTDTIDCIDPSHDSCFSMSVTGLTGNASDFGQFTFHLLNCSNTKLLCNEAIIKNYICDWLKSEGNASGVKFENCEISCCQGDLCNKPLGVPSASSFPRIITPPSPSASITIKMFGITKFPLNYALFAILGVVPLVVMNIF